MDPLHQPYDLPAALRDDFEKHGFVRIPALLDAATLRDHGAEITRLTLALNTQTKPMAERDTYDRAFLQIMNLWRHSERVREFVFGRRLARVAAELLGVKAVRLYHDQSLYKEPGGGLTPAHADQFYWPLSSDRTVTAWIPLQDTPADMGPLEFFAGSQNFTDGRDLPISDESETRITAAMQATGFPLVSGPFSLGEVSFHRGWTYHRATANTCGRPRSVMTMIYMDADIRLTEPTNPNQVADRERWCPGVAVGQVVDSPLNPVVYTAD